MCILRLSRTPEAKKMQDRRVTKRNLLLSIPSLTNINVVKYL